MSDVSYKFEASILLNLKNTLCSEKTVKQLLKIKCENKLISCPKLPIDFRLRTLLIRLLNFSVFETNIFIRK